MTEPIVAEVVGTEIEAEYQGNVYERTVKVRVNSEELDLFEGRKIINNEQMNTTVGLDLRGILVSEIEKLENGNYRIFQQPDRESKWSATIVGQLVSTESEKDDTNQRLLVEIGEGHIQIEIDDSVSAIIREKSIQEGDFIRIDCGRIDIVGQEEYTP